MEEIQLSLHLPVSPETVFKAWLDGKSHRNFTGGDAVIDARQGGNFSAWGGYITGIILKIEPYRRVVQSWRTTDFHAIDPSSTLELTFEKENEGTLLTLHHSDIPKGQGEKYKTGWEESYLIPMLGYFSMLAEKNEKQSDSTEHLPPDDLP